MDYDICGRSMKDDSDDCSGDWGVDTGDFTGTGCSSGQYESVSDLHAGSVTFGDLLLGLRLQLMLHDYISVSLQPIKHSSS